MTAKYAHLPPELLRSDTDSSFSDKKGRQILESARKHGIKNPVSVLYNGDYIVTWGHSRVWAAMKLGIDVPAVIFEQKPQELGEEVADPRDLFDCPTNYKPHKGLIAPVDRFWT